MSQDYNVELIKTNKCFLNEVSGQPNRQLYWKDDIHLSDRGTSVLLKAYDEHVKVIKEKTLGNGPSENKCFTCGETGHTSISCMYDIIQCWCCGKLGHKERDCYFR